MNKRALSALAAPLALASAVCIATRIGSHAANCEQGRKVRNPHCNEDPPPAAATPELDSLVLFRAGGLALGGLAWRQRRRDASE
jgi:hypothetical protein